VVWIPQEKILFGGCMLKALAWNGLGFTGDADVEEWPNTLNRLLEDFSGAEIVIPGHGDYSDLSLVYHTLELLKND
jgi:glyoxylase-like metal-dependent hydrolase (beta-lactamase superfamily II)